MNKDFVIFNLRECVEELEKTIERIETQANYGYGEYVVGVGHAYHHLNTAWNARNESEEKVRICSEEDYIKWRLMPNDEELL